MSGPRRPGRNDPPAREGPLGDGPLGDDPFGDHGPVIELDPAAAFGALDEGLPLALLPVRLEARFLPDESPSELVIRVFPDEIHADAHDPAFTNTELTLAQGYWDWVWRVGGDPAGVAEARAWLAEQLGPHRAVYVAYASRPAGEPPAKPVPVASPKLRAVETRTTSGPGVARLMPTRWAAYVDVGEDVAGPFWAAEPVVSPLSATPALVELPEGAGASTFLDEQGLGWMHDLEAAETAGMVIRIPLASLPERPGTGYDRLIVIGTATGSGHAEPLRDLLDAHCYTRGLDLLPPGTPTNVTADSPDGVATIDLDALFEAEFARDEPRRPERAAPPTGVPPPTAPPETAAGILSAEPADAVALALGLSGETAVHRAAAAADPEPELSRAINASLWPATWGSWFTDPMSMGGDPLIATPDIETLRAWFVNFVRAEGPLPTLRVGRHPYGLLPVTVTERHEGGPLFDRLETFLRDLRALWHDVDAVPVLDPDSSDAPPSNQVAEQASEVGAIYGATPHIRELRLRPVEDTQAELGDLYNARLGFAGLLCALMPKDDGSHFSADELGINAWYQTYLEHEPRARGGAGSRGQLDALHDMVDEIEALPTFDSQDAADLAIRTYIDPPFGDTDVITGDLVGMVGRHRSRVMFAQPYLRELGVHDALGAEPAPRLYYGGYGEDGTETAVGALVAPATEDPTVTAGWLESIRADVAAWQAGGDRPSYRITEPVSLLRQLLQHSAASVARGAGAVALDLGLARLRDLVQTDGPAAIATLERLMRGTLGLASYRVDAWLTAFASERLDVERTKRPTGLQAGGYGWLLGVKPREGGASQGHIHAPSLDHATTAAVLRSGWSAFGTSEAGSPLAVDLSAPRIRAARALIEGVRSGQDLGRLLGGRFERRLHDRHLDASIDDVRAAVQRGAGEDGPASRIVDGLLLARAYTEGIESTTTEDAVRGELDAVVTAGSALHTAILDTVTDLDAVSDLLMAQAVHALVRGDAGVAAPTLAATGSGDSGLPALDLPQSARGGRPVTVRVTAILGGDAVAPVWPGAATSPAAAAEPRLERWVGALLGDPGAIVAEVRAGARVEQVDLAQLKLGALDAVHLADGLAGALAAAAGLGVDAVVTAGRPAGLADELLSWGEFLAVARAVRETLGRLRAVTATDLGAEEASTATGDAADLQGRLEEATRRVPAGDPRLAALAQHATDHPGETVELLLERLGIVAGHPVPILPLLPSGVPEPTAASFSARGPGEATAAWLAQAAKVRPDLAAFTAATELAELAAGRALLQPAVAQSPDAGGPWAATAQPSAPGPHTAWCNLTGDPPAGPAAGFVVDAWTETIPAERTTSGIAVHFDSPSAMAPNAVLLAVTRPGQVFGIDHVLRCVRDTIVTMQLRALSPDAQNPELTQFLPAVFLPGDAAVIPAEEPA